MRKEERLSLLYPYLRLSFSARLSPSLSPAERGKRLVCSYRHAERSYLPRARPFVAFCLAAPRMRIYARVLLPHPRVPRPSSIIRSPWPREAAARPAQQEKNRPRALPLAGRPFLTDLFYANSRSRGLFPRSLSASCLILAPPAALRARAP